MTRIAAREDAGVVPEQLADELRKVGERAGLDAFGIASPAPFTGTRVVLEHRKHRDLHSTMSFTFGKPKRSSDVSVSVDGVRALVVGALDYSGTSYSPRDRGSAYGRVARFAASGHYARLRAALTEIATALTDHGHQATVLIDDNRLVDREAAYRAGIGWYGRNTNLLIKGKGSFFVLGSVATDALLPTASKPVADGCGSCSRCIPACPTNALAVHGELDARRCLTWLLQDQGEFPRQYRVALGNRMYGCDECQTVCPPTIRHERKTEPAPQAADAVDRTWVDLVEMLDMDDDSLLDRFDAWYVPRRQASYLRRNALVVLGNVGDPESGEVSRVVREALRHPDAIVRSHAVWAARRLGYDDAVDSVRHDVDHTVQAELAALTPARSIS